MESRPIKELLIILKDSLNNEFNSNGLCVLITFLYCRRIINEQEREKLREYLRKNIPFTKNVIKRRFLSWTFTKEIYCYWWTEGHKEPRLKWLDKQIKKRN